MILQALLLCAFSHRVLADVLGANSWGVRGEAKDDAVDSELAVVPYAEFSNPENIARPPRRPRRFLEDFMEIPLGVIFPEEEVANKFKDFFSQENRARRSENRKAWRRGFRDKVVQGCQKCRDKLKNGLVNIKKNAEKWGNRVIEGAKAWMTNMVVTKFREEFMALPKAFWTMIKNFCAKVKSTYQPKMKEMFDENGEPIVTAVTDDLTKELTKDSPWLMKAKHVFGFGKEKELTFGVGWGGSLGFIGAIGYGFNLNFGQNKELGTFEAAFVANTNVGAGLSFSGSFSTGITFCWNTSPSGTEGWGINVDIGFSAGFGAKVTLSWAWDKDGKHLLLNCIAITGEVGAGVEFKVSGSYAQTILQLDWKFTESSIPYFNDPKGDAKKKWDDALEQEMINDLMTEGDMNGKVPASKADAKAWASGFQDYTKDGLIVTDAKKGDELAEAIAEGEAPETDAELKDDFPSEKEADFPAASGGGGEKHASSLSEVKLAEEGPSIDRQERFVSQAVRTEGFVSQAVPTENKIFSDFIIQVTIAGSALVLILVGIALTSSSEKKTMSYKLLVENDTLEV